MTESGSQRNKSGHRRRGRRRRAISAGTRATAEPTKLPTVHEFSAGGLVVDGLDEDKQVALVIGRANHRGEMVWTLPKGHIEVGERAEQTAVREIAEETGIRGDLLAALGSVDFWFRAEHHVVHKTVHHYLLRFLDGEPSPDDREVGQVAWVPLKELSSWLTHRDERPLVEVAARLIQTLRSDGPDALPPLPYSSPRRLPQTHSIARSHSDRDGDNQPT